MKKIDPQVLVIFGASGDLTKRKLIPSVFALFKGDLLPDNFAVLGIGRTDLSDESFRKQVVTQNDNLDKTDCDPEAIDSFCKMLHYHAMDTAGQDAYAGLKDVLEALSAEHQIDAPNYIFYLSTPPKLYEVIARNLAAHDLNVAEQGWKRLIVEKPFGYDLESGKALNRSLLECFQEDQIYRIDHYLGKETVQNLLVTRFANGIFEPLWNRNYIHHVEITTAEHIGVEGRGGYYDGSGAMRDMIQNHLLQLVALVAMEPPATLDSTAIRNEKLKVFQSLRPHTEEAIHRDIIRGQYMPSRIKGETVYGYREEKGVDPESKTETFVAMKFFVDNWRWAGVPFYMRTGKRLPTRVAEIVIHFKSTPHHLFVHNDQLVNTDNQLVIRIQPNEGMLLKYGIKVPGAGFRVKNVNMDFHYADLTDDYVPDAYERLLLDSMLGDSTLYARGDSTIAAWEFINPVLDAWSNDPTIKLFGYPAGTWGPNHTPELIEGAGLDWRYPCKNLTDDGDYCEL